MDFKDLFSRHASEYKQCRPTYPEALFKYLSGLVHNHDAAWDCGTGNGQGAIGLAPHFSRVFATDASAAQIDQAEPAGNIVYSVATAEQSGLPDKSVSLVTIFQAIHWFDLDLFFREVKRVLQPDGVIAAIGYNTAMTGIDVVDETYKQFCFNYLWEKNCWEMGRHTLNSHYTGIDFPFKEIAAPAFQIEVMWNYHDYLSYLNTWSAVKKYIELYGENPVEKFVVPRIEGAWVDKVTPVCVHFPLVLRVGRKLDRTDPGYLVFKNVSCK